MTKKAPPYVEFAEVDDLWVRAYTIEQKGSVVSQHVHTHDHITLLASGSVQVWQDGKEVGTREAPSIITIPAGSKHGFVATSDNVVLCCLHNLRGTGETMPETIG